MRNLNGTFNMQSVCSCFRRGALGLVLAAVAATSAAGGRDAVVAAGAPEPAEPPVVYGVPSAARSLPRPSWKLVRGVPDDQGRSAVSMTKIADTRNSDPEMVGLMIRCSPPIKVEVALVVAAPFAPHSRPTVRFDSAGGGQLFEGRVAPGGAAIILPDGAAGLLSGPWRELDRIDVKVTENGRDVAGRIELDGLPSAFAEMMAKCAQ